MYSWITLRHSYLPWPVHLLDYTTCFQNWNKGCCELRDNSFGSSPSPYQESANWSSQTNCVCEVNVEIVYHYCSSPVRKIFSQTPQEFCIGSSIFNNEEICVAGTHGYWTFIKQRTNEEQFSSQTHRVLYYLSKICFPNKEKPKNIESNKLYLILAQ